MKDVNEMVVEIGLLRDDVGSSHQVQYLHCPFYDIERVVI